jgi:hypothetical protein
MKVQNISGYILIPLKIGYSTSFDIRKQMVVGRAFKPKVECFEASWL